MHPNHRDPEERARGPRERRGPEVAVREVSVPEIEYDQDPDLAPSGVPRRAVDLDLGSVPIPEVDVDVTPRDATPQDLNPRDVSVCDIDSKECCAEVADLREQIADERRESLREREDVDADQSFPASDPPARY